MLALVLLLLTADGAVVTKPDWVGMPTAEDMEAFYPREARVREIEGKATIECRVTVEGTLVDCVVISEEPGGLGFGEATVNAAAKFRMSPKTVNGKPVGDGTVRIPLQWTLGGDFDPAAMRAGLAEAEACVGFAQARTPGLRGSGRRDLFLYRHWTSAFVGYAAHVGLKPSEITRRLETLRVEAARKLERGAAVPERCLAPVDDFSQGI